MAKIDIITHISGHLYTNCYLVKNNETSEGIIIDPADHGKKIINEINANKIKPAAILLTHGHFDHIAATQILKDNYNIPVYAAKKEEALLGDPYLNGSTMVGKNIKQTADKWLSDKDIITISGIKIEAISTPGHTAGSLCYYIKEINTLFSGDTLFYDSIGRTDFPTGDFKEIKHSICEKLFNMTDETKVYPGHGEKTNIAREKEHNMIKDIIKHND